MKHPSSFANQRTRIEYTMTTREAVLMVRIGKQFPHGFSPPALALSLGWSLDSVYEALETCVACGLIAPPVGYSSPSGRTIPSGRRVSVRDLLTPAEMTVASGRDHYAI